jgi:hypothetical protein
VRIAAIKHRVHSQFITLESSVRFRMASMVRLSAPEAAAEKDFNVPESKDGIGVSRD